MQRNSSGGDRSALVAIRSLILVLAGAVAVSWISTTGWSVLSAASDSDEATAEKTSAAFDTALYNRIASRAVSNVEELVELHELNTLELLPIAPPDKEMSPFGWYSELRPARRRLHRRS